MIGKFATFVVPKLKIKSRTSFRLKVPTNLSYFQLTKQIPTEPSLFTSLWHSLRIQKTKNLAKVVINCRTYTAHPVYGELSGSLNLDGLQKIFENMGPESLPSLQASEWKDVQHDPRLMTIRSKMQAKLRDEDYMGVQELWVSLLSTEIIPEMDIVVLVLESCLGLMDFIQFDHMVSMIGASKMPKEIGYYVVLLKKAYLQGDTIKAVEYWKEMLQEVKRPNIRAVEHYMSTFGKHIDLHLATCESIYEDIPKEFNLIKDQAFENAFMKILFEAGEEVKAMELWNKMGKLGKDGIPLIPSPNNQSIQILMEHHLRKQNFNIVESLFLDISGKYGLKPTSSNCIVLLHKRLQQKEYVSCFDLFKEMCHALMKPDLESAMGLLGAFYETNDLANLESLLVFMPKSNLRPSKAFIEVAITSICKMSNPDKGMAFIIFFREKIGVPVPSTAYATVLFAYGSIGNTQKVITVYRHMIFKDGLKGTPSTFVALLSAYWMAGHCDGVCHMLQHPDTYGIPAVNRFYFEEILELAKKKDQQAIHMLFEFDWTQIRGSTETTQDLQKLNTALRASIPQRSLPPSSQIPSSIEN